jgi:putative Holliday junction resolvase
VGPRTNTVILAFDVGERRIGVAKAVIPPRLAQPLATLLNDATLVNSLQHLITQEQPDMLVVGLPRNQAGDTTAQSRAVEAWAEMYLMPQKLPIHWQDESLTSVAAEEHLAVQGKKQLRGDVDSLAATIILTDFLETMHAGEGI